MRVFRAILVWLLSVILFGALIGLALSTGFGLTLGKQSRVEGWLSQSGIYNHFVSAAVERAPQTVTVNFQSQSATVPLDKTAIQQAAESAFPAPLLKQTTNSFLAANYAWLQGKTATPQFHADLTPAKANFAQAIGRYVQRRFAALPACTPEQLAQYSSDVSTLITICLPPGTTPEAAGAAAAQQAAASSEFLANPKLSAASFNLSGTPESTPYYQRFDHLPRAYQGAMKLPWLFGALAILCIIAIIFIAFSRRRGLRHAAWTLVVAGIILLLFKLCSNAIFTHIQNRVVAAAHTQDVALKSSLLDAMHRAEAAATQIDAWFGVGYLALAIIIFLTLILTRRHYQKATPVPPPEPSTESTPRPTYRHRSSPPKPPKLIQ